MRIKLKALLFIATLFTPLLSYADYTPRWTPEGTIEGIYVDLRENLERVLIRHSVARIESGEGADDCFNDGDYYELKLDSVNADRVYSLLLTAQTLKQNVKIYLKGCSNTGFPYALIVDQINVSK